MWQAKQLPVGVIEIWFLRALDGAFIEPPVRIEVDPALSRNSHGCQLRHGCGCGGCRERRQGEHGHRHDFNSPHKGADHVVSTYSLSRIRMMDHDLSESHFRHRDYIRKNRLVKSQSCAAAVGSRLEGS